MRRLVEFELESGGSILVEVDVEDDLADGELVPAANAGELVAMAGQSLEQALSSVRRVAASIIAQLEDLPRKPDEVTVEFGVKLAGKANAVFASGSAEANLNVTLTWAGDGDRAD